MWLHTEWNWADNITGMSSMENERNRLQWKTLPSTRVKGRTMCCQRYVILHATRHSMCTHLWVHDCRCKNTQTLRRHDCLDFSVMRYDDGWSWWGLTGRLISTMQGCKGLALYYSSLTPEATGGSAMSVFTLPGHMVVFTLKQAAEWEVSEIGSGYLPNRAVIHLLFGLNLSLTPRCPLRLRDAICFLFFLPKEGRQAPLPLRCNLWSEKNK